MERLDRSHVSARSVLSLREMVYLADLPEKRVRKDMENGILETPNILWYSNSRVCFPWLAVFVLAGVYRNRYISGPMRRVALSRSCDAFNIGSVIRSDWWSLESCSDLPLRLNGVAMPLVSVDEYLKLDFRPVVELLAPKVCRYMSGLSRVEEKADVLGGAAVFKGSRLPVSHVAKMIGNGESRENILEDYPYLSESDLDFATVYDRLHPISGRPRNSNSEAAWANETIVG